MCGIVGFLSKSSVGNEATLRSMCESIFHRGPDDQGTWIDPTGKAHLGFRRLSILDLSEAGHQPMKSRSGRWVCTFNGEIYNFQSLKDRLSDFPFRGHSDTEVLLEHIDKFGISETLSRAAGMFALSLWNLETQELTLARDRFGEKPLYYGWSGGSLIYGSELKAFRNHPDFRGEVDPDVLALYLRFGYVPSPWSIYKGIYKLPAASSITFQSSISHPEFKPFADSSSHSPQSYWRLVAKGQNERVLLSDQEAIDKLDDLLRRVIKQEMVSDVPLGSFLSGGIDSSTVVAIMQAVSDRPVKSFTIGFHEASHNEAEHAKAVAKHLGTDHTEYYVRPQEALDVLPYIPTLYDEPFADPSQIPTYLVSKLARKEVTVCLSGDGGDELLGGYSRYFVTQRLWNRLRNKPRFARSLSRRLLTTVPPHVYDRLGGLVSNKVRLVGDKAHKLAGLMESASERELYLNLISLWNNPNETVLNSQPRSTLFETTFAQLSGLNLTEQMMMTDAMSYLPDDIMVKVDRASMAVSLESRAPLLHHELSEFAWSLPYEMKVRDGQGKWLLRQVLDRYVPRHLIDRPKMGFAVPIGNWMKGPLREWAEPLLNPARLNSDGYFHPDLIQQKWQEHLSGKRNWQHQLWAILMFQAWLDDIRI